MEDSIYKSIAQGIVIIVFSALFVLVLMYGDLS